MSSLPQRSAALFGEDHAEAFEYALCSLGGEAADRPATACALSVGGPEAISRKGGVEVPNEDALFAYDDGRHALLVVADGHHGPEASQALVEGLAEVFRERGPGFDPVEALPLLHAATPAPDSGSRSRATLLVAALDRTRGRLRGLSIGDSVIFLASAEGGLRRLVATTRTYAAPWDLTSLGVPPSCRFDVAVVPGDVIVACTDGVTECHYGRPDSSVRDEDIAELLTVTSGAPDVFVEALLGLALMGVRDQPGGEDNVAVVATVV